MKARLIGFAIGVALAALYLAIERRRMREQQEAFALGDSFYIHPITGRRGWLTPIVDR